MLINKIIASLPQTNQPIILILNQCSNPDLFLKQFIAKKTNLKDEEEFLDLFRLDNFLSSFKKNDAIELQKFASYSATNTSGLKFYYLTNFETATNESFSSLLKFIEEPHPNLYGVITTKNINIIPDTIKSRCLVFYLDTDNDAINQLKSETPILQTNKYIFKIFSDICELKSFINTKEFSDFDWLINEIIQGKQDQIYKMQEIFKSWNYYIIKLFLLSLLQLAKYEQKQEINQILEKITLNPIKTVIFTKIILIFGQ